MSATAAGSAKPLIVVIDDDDATRDALIASLETLGYRATGASDGATAVETVTRDRPAAILLDLYMPDMDGFEVLSALKAVAADVPAIMMSGSTHGRAGDLLRMALAFGAAAILKKPFPIEDLAAALQKALAPR